MDAASVIAIRVVQSFRCQHLWSLRRVNIFVKESMTSVNSDIDT